jgi:hypothetical protein
MLEGVLDHAAQPTFLVSLDQRRAAMKEAGLARQISRESDRAEETSWQGGAGRGHRIDLPS